jgi:predicted acetyltransferase
MDEQQSPVSIVQAETNDKAAISNLIQLYLYDMTGDLPFPVGRDGRFDYEFLDRFWQHPYFILRGDELAGFALVIKGSPVTDTPDCFFVAEFFVLKAYRGRGVGLAAFEQILRAHAGKWQIGVIDKNKVASAFWAKAVEPYHAISFQHRFDGENWKLYEFQSLP